MQYFPLLYRLNSDAGYLICISNENDRVVVDGAGFVPTFRDIAGLRAFAAANNYSLENEEPELHDLDWVAAWTKTPAVPVDCKHALAAWNLFADVANSILAKGGAFRQLDNQLTIYDKLFRGNNLPAMTPNCQRYVPDWSANEIALLAQLLRVGLALFKSCTRSCTEPSPRY